VAALAGNSILTVIKFLAFLFSGSGAMLSEAIHSAADTGNQGLLYLGIRRSERRADAMFHYGYGADRFLFALLSAVGIFVLGCGVTVYHGVHNLFQPPDLHLNWVVFGVLATSLLLDGAVLLRAVDAVSASKGDKSFWQHIRTTPDPTVLAVLFEDSVACVGVVLAAGGILLSYATGNPVFDAVSSIAIGLLMGVIAVWLGWRNRQLILGPAIPAAMQAEVAACITSQPSVTSVRDIKSRVVAADRFLFKAEVDYNGRYLAKGQLAWAKAQLADLDTTDERRVEAFVGEFGERLLDALGREVDRIEADVLERFPDLKHLDLESDWRPGD